MRLEPHTFLVIYLSIETLKFLAAKIINHKEQMTVIKEIVRHQRDSAAILERILESHDIKPKEEKTSEENYPKIF